MKWFYLAMLLPAFTSFGEDVNGGISAFLPQPLQEEHFSALQEQSPFTRTLNLSDSLILTGVATVDEERVATLLNKETKETFVVSAAPNSHGWKMVELKENGDLEKVAARISVDGGEVVTVRYAEWQLKPGEAKPGSGPGQGPGSGNGDQTPRGDGHGPPPEFREKMSALSEEQRQKLYQKMIELREKKPDLSREERGKIMMETMDKMIQKNK